ncbi:hypothetical protein [Thermobacillus composti]|uniref:hypothetical protein n=1 Tax=Thermobacillus composti TaxID=377615 RepID=UPI00022C5940|nr:hypothetical protein [Thermobacillus composti]
MAAGTGKSRSRLIVWIGAILAAILALLVVITEVSKSLERTQAEVWRLNWGFDTPEPEQLERILAYPGRDHAQYSIARYSEEAVREMLAMPDWVSIESAAGYVSALIDAFMTDLQQWYPEDREKIAQLFVQHPPVFDEQDYYLVKNESDGDRLIAVLNPDLRTLYVLESYQ